jgi:AraC family transcriptional regulator
MFNKATYHTPYEYIMKRRLSESAVELLNTNKQIIEIAYDYQFNNPESYSRAFKRMFFIQPSKFRKQGRITKYNYMPKLEMDYLDYVNSDVYTKPIMNDHKSYILAGYTSLINNELPFKKELWELFCNDLNKYDLSDRHSEYYSLYFFPDESNMDRFFYTVAFKIDTIDSIQDKPFHLHILPKGSYLKTQHNGSFFDIKYLLNFLYHTWKYKSRKRKYLPYVIERFNTKEPLEVLDGKKCMIDLYIPIKVLV